jgi:transcription elongation factor GreB
LQGEREGKGLAAPAVVHTHRLQKEAEAVPNPHRERHDDAATDEDDGGGSPVWVHFQKVGAGGTAHNSRFACLDNRKMNKAFVKENNRDDEDEDPVGVPALPPGTKNYMTPAGHAALRAEFEQLVKLDRPHLVQVVAWAASNGDRSENGDYIYGKKKLREMDRRIRYLAKRLDNAEVVDPATQQNLEQVFFGAAVTVMHLGGDEAAEVTYRIVGIDEADPGTGKISWISPLARALMKAREGDLVKFQSPAGLREIEIIEIDYDA